MGYSNGSITEPVSIYDIQRALGESSEYLGVLCRSDKINKWARYKPVIHYGFPIRFHGSNSDPNYVNFMNKTGLNIGSIIGLPSDVASWSGVSISYEKPNGTISSPYRFTDFVRYNQYAQMPASVVFGSVFKLDRSFTSSVSINNPEGSEASEYISFNDILNEISGYDGFKNADKRLCLAIYDNENDDVNPIWYFFSDKFTASASAMSGFWTVSTNMQNSSFKSLLTVGRTYKFLVMLVSNHSYLEDIVSGDRERWEFGVSPTDMAVMESGANPIQAMCLAFEDGMDRTLIVLQQASVITDLSYYMDCIYIEKHGNIVIRNQYHILCIWLQVPNMTVNSRNVLNSSARYQLRVRFSKSYGDYMIFRPTDNVGGNYYEVESIPSNTLASPLAVTPWVSVADINSPSTHVVSGETVYEYEFDFYNRTYTILSRTLEQTRNDNSGLFLFFDQEGSAVDIIFDLYYKENASAQETLIHSTTVQYDTSEAEGSATDITF